MKTLRNAILWVVAGLIGGYIGSTFNQTVHAQGAPAPVKIIDSFGQTIQVNPGDTIQITDVSQDHSLQVKATKGSDPQIHILSFSVKQRQVVALSK